MFISYIVNDLLYILDRLLMIKTTDFMLLDTLSKQWMYEVAQAARRKLSKCATPLGCDVLLCNVPLQQDAQRIHATSSA